MIIEDYVSYETAKLLKEKGFDWECKTMKFFPEPDYDQESPDGVYAPTIQMAMKWLREVHNIFIDIAFRFSRNADNDINFSYYAEKYENYYGYGDGEFNSYEEACEAAIKYCLENLI